MLYQNIPQELRELNQWVVAQADKVPVDPKTGKYASVDDPSTWASFEEAVNKGYRCIGFVLTKDDPYLIIDLDSPRNAEDIKRQEKILAKFKSYTERSVSGSGYHIVLKGAVEKGFRRDKVEVYSSGRYMIFTGNRINRLPITDQQALVDALVGEMSRPLVDTAGQDSVGIMRDSDLVDMAMNAVNGKKFTDLCNGLWEQEYPSQSEADYALLSILCFYTPDNNQVMRIFRLTKLGERPKALRNDYLLRCINKIRSNEIPFLDLSKLTEPEEPVLLPSKEVIFDSHLPLPDGLLKDITEYIFNSSLRPVYEVALAGAIGLFSALVGRQYNVSGSGLNQYVMLLAPTGSGKEGASSGIDRIMNELSKHIPMMDTFVGPASFSSGIALVKALSDKPSFLSILGEFGITLQQLASPRAPTHMVTLKQALLDVYQKSSWGSVLKSSVYSDKEKNTKLVYSPCLSILGETTPSVFYESLNQDLIADGLIPRLLIIEFTGKRPATNKNAFAPPPPAMIKQLIDVIGSVLQMRTNSICYEIGFTPDAQQALERFDKYCDDKINSSDEEVIKQLWNRSHLKALKLASLLAVGLDNHIPLIHKAHADWAIAFVKRDAEKILSKFSSNEVGNEEARRDNILNKYIKNYFTLEREKKLSYSIPEVLVDQPIITYDYLRRRTKSKKEFLGGRGRFANLKDAIKELCDSGILVELNPQQAYQQFGITRMLLYTKGANYNDIN